MKVRILRSTVADGRTVLAGEEIILSGADAAMLIRLGKAIPLPDEPLSGPPGDGTTGPAPVPTVDGKPAQKRRR